MKYVAMWLLGFAVGLTVEANRPTVDLGTQQELYVLCIEDLPRGHGYAQAVGQCLDASRELTR